MAEDTTERLIATTCLVPVWDDGTYRVRCGMGTAGVCARHGRHKPHPSDGRPCDLADDGYCGTHGIYADRPSPPVPAAEDDAVRQVAQIVARAALDWTDTEGDEHEHTLDCTNWRAYLDDARAAPATAPPRWSPTARGCGSGWRSGGGRSTAPPTRPASSSRTPSLPADSPSWARA